MFARLRAAWRAFWNTSTALPALPAPVVEKGPEQEPDGIRISHAALWESARHNVPVIARDKVFRRAEPIKGALPEGFAMDSLPEMPNYFADAYASIVSEGLGFLGYQYLAELSQRAEYRKIAQIWADHCVRKWIKFSGDEAKVKQLEARLNELGVKQAFREAIELESFFGRIQIFPDFGDSDDDVELRTPLDLIPEKIGPDRPLKGVKVIQPLWSYPGIYEATNPLAKDFYVPREWYVMGKIVHHSRLLTIVSHAMPDMLKPAYAFGGISMAQMAKPYVDNWLRNRQSGSDLLNAFTTWVLKTDMEQVLSGGPGTNLWSRLEFFSNMMANRGVFAIDKNKEEFQNVSAPITGVHEIIAQSQEHMSAVSGIPLVQLTGITPSGLNASSDGEIRVFYDAILSYLERNIRAPLDWIVKATMLSLWGEIDSEITYEFVSLWEMSDKDKADIRKSNADSAAVYIAAGVISPEEDRERLNNEDEGMYAGSLEGPAPEIETGEADFFGQAAKSRAAEEDEDYAA